MTRVLLVDDDATHRLIHRTHLEAAAVAAIPPTTGLPPAVTGSLTTGTTAAFTVDFATYAAYDVYLEGVSPGNSNVAVDVSSNGGTSFPGKFPANIGYVFGTTSYNSSNELPGASGQTSHLVGTLTQPSATGGTVLSYVGSVNGSSQIATQTGITRYPTTAAVNQVRLSLGTLGGFTAGTVILQPKSRR